jgi:hypothetical protein
MTDCSCRHDGNPSRWRFAHAGAIPLGAPLRPRMRSDVCPQAKVLFVLVLACLCTVQSCLIEAHVVTYFVQIATPSTGMMKPITSLWSPSFAVRSFVFLFTSCTTERATTQVNYLSFPYVTSRVNTAKISLHECYAFAKTSRIV